MAPVRRARLSWPAFDPATLRVDERERAAAIGCLRIAVWLRRVGMDSTWRFQPGDRSTFEIARVLLIGGDIQAEVGFAADDLALAATDDAAVAELARQAITEWRQREHG